MTTLSDVAADVEANADGHFAAPDREEVAALLRWSLGRVAAVPI